MHFGHRRCALACAVALLYTSPGFAQSGQAAAAESLFKQGRELFDAGHIHEACEKFAESERLDPSPGTQLNLARCLEAEGKTASAWSGYLAAKRTAQAAGRDALAEEASRRAQEVEGKLSYLTVNVPVVTPGLEVFRGDVLLEAATYGTRLPIDPGKYVLRATAPDHVQWQGEVTLRASDEQSVTVPSLQPAPTQKETPPPPAAEETPAAPAPATPATPTEPPGAPVAAFVVGGAGVVVTGVGLVFGGLAKSKYDEALAACPTRMGCTNAALATRSDADTFATVSTVMVPIGLAALGAGIVMWILHDDEPEQAARVAPAAAWVPGGGVATLSGVF